MTSALRHLSSDAWLLFATRFTRLFAYGALSVVLVFYLIRLGLSEGDTGLLLTLTLLGDTLVSLYLTTRADRIYDVLLFRAFRSVEPPEEAVVDPRKGLGVPGENRRSGPRTAASSHRGDRARPV